MNVLTGLSSQLLAWSGMATVVALGGTAEQNKKRHSGFATTCHRHALHLHLRHHTTTARMQPSQASASFRLWPNGALMVSHSNAQRLDLFRSQDNVPAG